MARSVAGAGLPLDDLDGYVGRIGDDVVDSRAFLRLRDERFDILLRRVGIDVEGDLDVAVAVAYIAVDAQDALEIHLALEFCLHRSQLYSAVLRYGSHARRQATRETYEHQFYRGRTLVLGGEDLGVIGLERELSSVRLLAPESMESLHRRGGVGAASPFA